MQRSIKTRIVFKVALASLAAGALIACGDSRINKLTPGISRDSALKVINEGTSGDSLARVYKQETYLVNGQLTNILFYNKNGVRQKQDSTLAAKAQTPIVTVDGKVTGWGWEHYDSVAKAMNFKPTPRR
jgi:hypothetical protein